MPAAPIPENDAARLAALRRLEILDSEPEIEFDDITRLAAHICGTPIALISFVDADRQWFKSTYGLDMRESTREAALCGYAILGDEVLEIPNTLEDSRVHDSALVTGQPHLRFYAGAPVAAADGMAVGTLCVLDQVPRQLSTEQKDALAALSRLLSRHLEYRMAVRRERTASDVLDELVRERSTALRESERFARDTLNALRAQIAVLDDAGTIISTNLAWRRFAEENSGDPEHVNERANYLDVSRRSAAAGSTEAAAVISIVQKLIDGGANDGAIEYPCHSPTEQRWFIARFARFENAGAVRVIASHENVTALRQAAAALAESEERFRQLAEQSRDVFWFLGWNPARILYVSPSIETMLGFAAESFYQDADLWERMIHPEDRQNVSEAFSAAIRGERERFEADYRVVLSDGSERWISNTGTPIRDDSGRIVRIGGLARDVTERRQLEAQFLQSQKMESVGQFAGSIAHDFNNLLTVINGTAEIAAMGLEDGPVREDLREILRTGNQAAGLTRQLLAFSRQQVMRFETLDLNAIVTDMHGLLRRLLGSEIAIELDTTSDEATIRGDRSQVEQVILNLAVNARDAMPRGGTLRIATRCVTGDSVATHVGSPLQPINVALIVSDTGTGIDEATRTRIFEPFFTTKPTGQGTGLGLSTVFGIVSQSGGAVHVSSTVGEGTTFTVYLPYEKAS